MAGPERLGYSCPLADNTENARLMAEVTPSKPETDSPNVQVAVCICTYQRPQGLQALLSALCDQVFTDVPPPVVTVIVTDNECSDINRGICDRYAQRCGYSLSYLREPQRGISHARNTCLDNLPAGTDFVAMIDDDEIPDRGWLNHLLVAQRATSADIVTGPTLPLFNPDTPAWIVQTGYFAKPHHPENYRDLQEFPPTATCNVLMRARIFTSDRLRFDPALALSGGEDKLLFQYLKQRGLKFVWAANAGAIESIPPARANLRYMLSESLRRGSTRFYVKTRLKAAGPAAIFKLTLRSTLRSLFGIVVHGAGACLHLAGGRRKKDKLALSLLNTAENIGFLGGVFGYRKSHY
jgi:glycosyltransferase involved in cell wall biosynthesis